MNIKDVWAYRAVSGGYWAKKHGSWYEVDKAVYDNWLTSPIFYRHIETIEDHSTNDGLLAVVILTSLALGSVVFWCFVA